MTHLFILGGSGRTGGHIIEYALTQGHTLTALVREPARLGAREGLTIVDGTPLDAEAVDRAITAADGVIVALNSNRASDRPWSKPISPPRPMADSVANTTAAMARHGIRRIVIVSAFGVGDSFSEEPFLPRWVIQHTNLSYTYADHNLVDVEIRATDIDWTLLRPVALDDKPAVGRVAVTEISEAKPSFFVSRQDVARFAVDIIDSPRYIHQTPIISRR